tara:strand:- start:199 stop:474 length:276 start_codon:yes stop_codon:yes gene_type:complete
MKITITRILVKFIMKKLYELDNYLMLQELLQDKPNELHKKNIEANLREIEKKALEEDKITLPFPENDYHSLITKKGENNDTRPNNKHTSNN